MLGGSLPNWSAAKAAGSDSPREESPRCGSTRLSRQGWENFAGTLGWENVYVTAVITDENKPVEGMNMVEIKEHRGAKDEFTALYELLLEEDGAPGMVIFYGDEDDVKRIMKHPLHMVGTDAGCCNVEGPFCKGKPHPRHYGTYPKVLGKYVREEKVITWEEAVRKMTSFPALIILHALPCA